VRLLQHLQWHGVGMVEFKEDVRDGSIRLMEINARFWGSLQLSIDAGVDFPAILADIALGRPVTTVKDYRVGVRSRWLLGDLDVVLMVLFRDRRKLNLPNGFPPRLCLLWDFLHLGGRNEYYEVCSRDDPGPWFLELRQWFGAR
jgi:hypothetical protein